MGSAQREPLRQVVLVDAFGRSQIGKHRSRDDCKPGAGCHAGNHGVVGGKLEHPVRNDVRGGEPLFDTLAVGAAVRE